MKRRKKFIPKVERFVRINSKLMVAAKPGMTDEEVRNEYLLKLEENHRKFDNHRRERN